MDKLVRARESKRSSDQDDSAYVAGARAQVAETSCTCEEGWGGAYCEQRSMHCDPTVAAGNNASASIGHGMYQCVEMPVGVATSASGAVGYG